VGLGPGRDSIGAGKKVRARLPLGDTEMGVPPSKQTRAATGGFARQGSSPIIATASQKRDLLSAKTGGRGDFSDVL